jgi:hypothetical protein
LVKYFRETNIGHLSLMILERVFSEILELPIYLEKTLYNLQYLLAASVLQSSKLKSDKHYSRQILETPRIKLCSQMLVF